jgi:large conductance mechanosensitive channel
VVLRRWRLTIQIAVLRRWLREYTEFFFNKGNALDLAIGVLVATQFQQVVDVLTKDVLMPLLNPLVRNGNWQDLVVPYFGGQIMVGRVIDVIINSLIVGWALFVLIKLMNRARSLGESVISGQVKE